MSFCAKKFNVSVALMRRIFHGYRVSYTLDLDVGDSNWKGQSRIFDMHTREKVIS